MAKQSIATSFKNAKITEENGEFIITEYTKDDTKQFNLTKVLREYIGTEGLSIRISKDGELPSEE